MIPAPPSGYDQTLEAIFACGVRAANIHIAYADELQSDVVSIKDLGGTDEGRLHCLRQATHPAYLVMIEAKDQRAAYFAYTDREERRQARAEAIEWLRDHQMLGRVPLYSSTKGLTEFARDLETACSVSPGSTLEAVEPNILTFRRGSLEQGVEAGAYETFTCLRRMVAASYADEYDIRVAFIGNEAFDESR